MAFTFTHVSHYHTHTDTPAIIHTIYVYPLTKAEHFCCCRFCAAYTCFLVSMMEFYSNAHVNARACVCVCANNDYRALNDAFCECVTDTLQDLLSEKSILQIGWIVKYKQITVICAQIFKIQFNFYYIHTYLY